MQNYIATGLVLALSAFGLGLIVHILVWRIYQPRAYPIWLCCIFAGTFLVTLLSFQAFGQKTSSLGHVNLVAGVMLYTLLVACYGLSYGGIVDFSPSVEILREVAKSMPQGISQDALKVDDLTDSWLIDNRINHLVAVNLLRDRAGMIEITEAGTWLLLATVAYRRGLGQSHFGQG